MNKNSSLTIIVTVFIIVATIAIAFFLASDHTLENKLDQELFLLIFRALLTIVLAGLGILAYRAFTIERDLSTARRADLVFVYRELRDAHLEVMQVIHEFRASIGFESGVDAHKESLVDPKLYERSLSTFLRAQLIFRSNSNRVRDYHLGYTQANLLADQLCSIEAAFCPLIEEYEAESIKVRESGQQIKIKALPELEGFLSLNPHQHPFAGQSLRSFESGILGLSKARHEWNPIA